MISVSKMTYFKNFSIGALTDIEKLYQAVPQLANVFRIKGKIGEGEYDFALKFFEHQS